LKTINTLAKDSVRRSGAR